jgi:2-dehydro-3-deoxyphosphogalactonate aldolase
LPGGSRGLGDVYKRQLPGHVRLIPVGGIGAHNMANYRQCGASGFGIGSALYAPGKTVQAIGESAAAFVRAWHAV